MNLALDVAALREPRGQRGLDRRVHGEEGIGDDLQPAERVTQHRNGSGGGDPRCLHLRQRADLAQATEHEGEALRITGGKAARRRGGEGVVQKDLVHDQREATFGA